MLNKNHLPSIGLGLLMLLLLPVLLASCTMPNAFKEHAEFIQREVIDNPEITGAAIQTDQLSLAYHYVGVANKATVVWIHGTPGGWSDIGRLLVDKAFLQDIKLVSIDRPGWGASQPLNSSDVYPSFDQQSYFISPLLVQLKAQHPDVPLLLAGHSWGGSLVPLIAADNPEIVDGVLVLAGGLSAKLTKPRWYNKLARFWPISALIGEDLRQSNIEMYALSANLTELDSRWQELANMPMVVVQGGKDPLVNPANADYIENILQNLSAQALGQQTIWRKVLRKPDYGHLLQIKHTDLIAGCVFSLLDKNALRNNEPDKTEANINAFSTLQLNKSDCS
jgi:pimeloyl-ACP methyl ester carboxylesterase